MNFKATVKLAAAAVFCFSFGTTAAFSDYPEKAIEMIVPFGAGGGFDTLARNVAAPLEEILGVPVVVRNIPGSGGRTGSVALFRSPNDGYTIGFFDADSMLADEILFERDPPVNYLDIRFIWTVATARDAILVAADSTFDSLDDLIAAGRPIKLSSTGVGSSAFLTMSALSGAAGFPVEFVHGYESVPESVLGTLRGDTDASIAGFRHVSGMLDEVKAIVFLARGERSENFPDVPTIEELGYPVLGDLGTDYAISAPPGTSEEAVSILADALAQVTASDSFKQWAIESGYAPTSADGQQTRENLLTLGDFYRTVKPFLDAAQ